MVGDVVQPKRNMMACQDVLDRDAEGGSRRLNDGEHGVLYEPREEKPQAPIPCEQLQGLMENDISEIGGVI